MQHRSGHPHDFAHDPTAALTAYCDAYATALGSLRAAGLEMPVMIDAPDCGTSLDAFTTVLDPVPGTCVGQQLIDADPLHNVILSTHAYWAGTDHTDAIDDAVALNLPLVMGEIANKQADGGDECHFGIDGTHLNADPPSGFQYQVLLTKLLGLDIVWLAWSWHPDGCPARNMAEYDDATGDFIKLTPYGEDIVNNPTYGLKPTATRF